MSGVPQTTRRSSDFLWGPRAFSICLTYVHDLLQWKDTKQNQQREKAHGGKVQRKPGARFQESFPRGATQDELNFPSNEL